MNKQNSSSPLRGADEYLHQPSDENKWRESYYFNWADLKNKISGFSTIGIVPNEKKREFVFFLFLKDRNEVYYREPPLLKFEENIDFMLKDKNLSYKLLNPYKKWQIQYKSRNIVFDILFESRFPTYYFGLDSSASWYQHFEASGVINGYIRLKDREKIQINGFGQRDKSWGYRDWHQFDEWYAGHFQFENWSCAFRKDYIENKIDLSGHISKEEGNLPISEIAIKTINDSDKFNTPLRATYYIVDEEANSYTIEAKRIKKDSLIRFARSFQGGYTELFEQMMFMKNLETGEIGSGMMEHLRTFFTSKT